MKREKSEDFMLFINTQAHKGYRITMHVTYLKDPEHT
jgi:hypothetical protein